MAAPGAEDDLLPNETLYVNNLNEKIKKQELKKHLYLLFGQYGKIVEIVALRSLEMRGQAFIVYQDVQSSTKAIRELQGMLFFGKPIRVSFSKRRSDFHTKRDGTFVKRAPSAKKRQPSSEPSEQKKKPAAAKATPSVSRPTGQFTEEANNILFVENLPANTTAEMLQVLFARFAGLLQVRLIPARPGIAFVDFSDEYCAGSAMQNLQGFKFTPTNLLKITYAKK